VIPIIPEVIPSRLRNAVVGTKRETRKSSQREKKEQQEDDDY
jgi:hypothetical protein